MASAGVISIGATADGVASNGGATTGGALDGVIGAGSLFARVINQVASGAPTITTAAAAI
jgi:hypothetical protein